MQNVKSVLLFSTCQFTSNVLASITVEGGSVEVSWEFLFDTTLCIE